MSQNCLGGAYTNQHPTLKSILWGQISSSSDSSASQPRLFQCVQAVRCKEVQKQRNSQVGRCKSAEHLVRCTWHGIWDIQKSVFGMPTHVKRIRGIFLSGHGSHAPTDVSSVQCRTKYHWITWNVSLTTVTKGWAWYMLGFFLGEGLKHWSNWTSVKIVNGFLDNKIGLEANYLVPFHTLCPYSIGYLQGSLSIFPGLYVSPVLVCSWHPGATAWPKVGKVGACITSSSEIAFSRPATFIPHILEQNKTCYRVNPVWHAPSAASSCKIEQCRVMIWYDMLWYDMMLWYNMHISNCRPRPAAWRLAPLMVVNPATVEMQSLK